MFTKLLSVIMLTVVAAGCGVKAQTYVMTKERQDIVPVQGGNNGYIMGAANYNAPEKKTRKVYVLELTKPLSETETKKIEEEVSYATKEISTQEAPGAADDYPQASQSSYQQNRIVIPPIEDVIIPEETRGSDASMTEAVTYTVMKDDTLQKISKKFYNTYSKWIAIYEANKDKLKNPNFVKPGTVLIIPAQEGK